MTLDGKWSECVGTKKRCKACNVLKDSFQFYFASENRLQCANVCKECWSCMGAAERMRRYRVRKKERLVACI